MTSSAGKVLVYGGKGALGSNIVKFFRNKNWWVASIDMGPNSEADVNIVVTPSESWQDQNNTIQSKVAETLGHDKVDAILCVAGGWAGGNASSKDFIKNTDLVWKQSVWTSVIATSISSKYLKDGGLLLLTGAQGALTGSPGMIGYGLAKSAVHHLVKSLAEPKSGLPSQATVTAILPATLDTPMNRQFMPKADFSTWTPLETVSSYIFDWIQGKDRPSSGSLIKLITKDSRTECLPV
ncbi:hypothetical protein HELRODRAFT_65590 [Helobdella robusta]|uniref:Dihydropteridine reductase n=1 Tax=Helobdella robusta TaxID=6412 RepID=T1FYA4_HELRO|nr:hypothetical protein HELRODRAFT_65590 [Helobdella robusta]ESO02204.1 hypothetical protein HELRODRAFT_65590 [Helobdella robusta]